MWDNVLDPRAGETERINIAERFARFSERWQPKIVAELNRQEVKLVQVQGTFPWHHHNDVEEMFLVWRGRFRVEFRDRIVELSSPRHRRFDLIR
jgi:mannose-6-phosphate isomerase-like protein (cupin superfamily)